MTSNATHLRSMLATWAILAAVMAAQGPEQFVIDATETTMIIDVGRAGIFRFAGHDHEVAVPAVKGRIALDRSNITRSSVSAEFDAAALKVTGKGEPPEDVPEVQRVMLSDRVLDVQRTRRSRFSPEASRSWSNRRIGWNYASPETLRCTVPRGL